MHGAPSRRRKTSQQTNAHLLATRSLLEESARDHERLRLARELHDVAGHKLTALKLNLTALERSDDPAHSRRSRSRRSSPPSCWTISEVSSRRSASTTASTCARRSRNSSLRCPRREFTCDVRDDARVDNVAQAETLLRVVQEALTNIVRHSQAANAWIDAAARRQCGTSVDPRRRPWRRAIARRFRARGYARAARADRRCARNFRRPAAAA